MLRFTDGTDTTRAERDVVVALLEKSRIVLAMRLDDAQSSNCKGK